MIITLFFFYPCHPQRHQHQGWHRRERQRFPRKVSETGSVQPGADHGHLEGPDLVGQRVRSVRDFPGRSVRACDGSP